MRITETAVAKLDPGAKGEVLFRDSRLAGFAVRARRLADGAIRRDFLVSWQYRNGEGKRVSRRVFIGQHGNPWTADAARAEATRLLEAREKGGRVVSAKQAAKSERTVADLIDAFERDYLPGLKAKTQAEYRMLAKQRIRPKFGKLRVGELTRADVRDWHASARKTPFSANRALAVLSKMMAFAVEREWRADNPCYGVAKFKEKARERWLDEHDLPAFVKALANNKTAHGDCIRFLTVTGWRVSEALGLRWEMVDLQRLLARLPDTKTGGQDRPLSADAATIIDGQGHRSGFVFSTREGGSPIGYKQLREALQAVCEAAGIEPARPHDLRHTAASWAAISGAQAHELREAFGWKTLAMTNRYVGRAESLGRKGVDRAASAINLFGRESAEVVPIKGAAG